ncbi:MAG: hypothetical protein PVJ57_16010 [Phycisphaerae bacterium]|jgi:hypothetical protein
MMMLLTEIGDKMLTVDEWTTAARKRSTIVSIPGESPRVVSDEEVRTRR